MLDLTVIVPTVGRKTLARTLGSIPDGAVREVLVVPDGDDAWSEARNYEHLRLLKIIKPSWAWHGPPSTAGIWKSPMGKLGHPQRNVGTREATSKWLAFMDDDDTYADGAFDVIAAHLNGRAVPHIFQMRYHEHPHAPPGLILWQRQSVEYGNVGTPMFVVPNIKGKLGVWPAIIGGDYHFIRRTVALQGDPVWVPEVIAEVRP